MSVRLSIVIAVLNEAENIRPVCEELANVFENAPDIEILFVDDGSTDATCEALLAARGELLPGLRLLSHDRRRGKSAALRTGIEAAHGNWIATLDGDGQDDPAVIIDMLKRAEACKEGEPLVVGVRLKRSDRLSRVIATKLANGLRRRLLKDGCPDTGAPMKLFARSA